MPNPTLVIRGGKLVDGLGGAARQADVAVAGDRVIDILAPGAEVAGRPRVLDARNRIVTPGFVDVHTHDDLAVLTERGMDCKISQGITTVIVGNCGIGAAPLNDALAGELMDGRGQRAAILGRHDAVGWRSLGEYLEAVEQSRPALNVATLVPHNTLRLCALGTSERAATATEIRAMGRMAEMAAAEGGLGLSTGLIYPPGRAATRDELAHLAAAAGGRYVTHLRSEADELGKAVREAVDIGKTAGSRVHISHLKAAGRANWGQVGPVLELLPEGATVDVYPYVAASTSLREALAAAGRKTPVAPEEVLVSSAPGYESAEGMTLADIAAGWEVDSPAAVELLEDRCDGGVAVVYFAMCEDDVRTALRDPRSMIGSDGIPAGGKPHPRLYGTFPRVLGHYVRELGVLSLTEAVRKMTSIPAATFGLEGCGSLVEGSNADIVIFDPLTVRDNGTYAEPRVFSSGIDCVIVNGVITWQDGSPSGARAGIVHRRS